MIIGKTTLEEAIDKKRDCQTYFDATFIEKLSLTKKEQAKAMEVWHTARLQRVDEASFLQRSVIAN